MPTLIISEGSDNEAPSYSIMSASRGVKVPLDLADLERGHKVAEGVWYPMEPAASAEIRELVRSTGVTLGAAASLKAFLAIRKAAQPGVSIEDRTADRAISPLAFAPSGDDVPAGVQATLYPYQISGWRWLKFILAEGVGGLLADEMGLGKLCRSSAL
ncbi:MAG: hypothetical protein WDN29_04185 [Methylovirgula sp.]